MLQKDITGDINKNFFFMEYGNIYTTFCFGS